jgi:tRNA A-37 threonylcarbamoyl transferase component Bud32
MRALPEDLLHELENRHYPEEFLESYEPIECLSSNTMGETLLVEEKKSGEYHIAKCYPGTAEKSRVSESELLRKLTHHGLPQFTGEYKSESMLCVVREFANGITLDQWMKSGLFTQEEAVSIGLQLCDILGYLHTQEPPVIHRDIKPQNIVINDQGKVKLIDFGISRVYDKNAKNDTVCMGTMEFSPPEQFGYAQTDCRADIFSLGVLMRYLLTGETDAKAAEGKITNRSLAKIISRCAAFSPEDRYDSALKVKQKLLDVNANRAKQAARILFRTAALAVLLAVGFAAGRYTDVFAVSPAADTGLTEPLMEQAVRASLHKSEGALTKEDLANVEEIYLFGTQTADNLEDYYTLGGKYGIEDNQGSVVSLSDVVKMPNLRVLRAANQKIKDISPIAGLKDLKELDINSNPVEDISAVKGLAGLTFIGLYDTEVTDLSPLASCKQLNQIVMNYIDSKDFSFLAAIGDIEYLHAAGIKPELLLPQLQGKSVRQLKIGDAILPSLKDLQGIKDVQDVMMNKIYLGDGLAGVEALPYLTNLRIENMDIEDFSPLLQLKYLSRLEISQSLKTAVEKIADQAKFEIVYI